MFIVICLGLGAVGFIFMIFAAIKGVGVEIRNAHVSMQTTCDEIRTESAYVKGISPKRLCLPNDLR